MIEEPTHIFGVKETGDMGAPATRDGFAPLKEKKKKKKTIG
jgi:hypothetical protein